MLCRDTVMTPVLTKQKEWGRGRWVGGSQVGMLPEPVESQGLQALLGTGRSGRGRRKGDA